MVCCSDWKQWISFFFTDLEMYEDVYRGQAHKKGLCDSICKFLDDPTESKAENVYSNFFTSYWIGNSEKNPFLDLINKVSEYEQTASSLIRNQRDHYCHAVYVFITGLVIYQQSKKFRSDFEAYLVETKYKDAYTTKHEEFLYRWGLASLFHDVAYPLEITIKQLNEYYNCTVSFGDVSTNKYLDVKGFEEYKICDSLKIEEKYRKEFVEKYEDLELLEKTDSCELLAMDLASSLMLDYTKLIGELSVYDKKVSEGIIDHAYFGSLICMKWHSALINNSSWNPAYFYYPILDVSSSIFLHNAYQHLIMKKFERGKLKVNEKPVAFLLIFADTLQEWNRKGYGISDTSICPFDDIDFEFSDDGGTLQISYVVNIDYPKNIYESLDNILDISSLFNTLNIILIRR